MEVACGDWVRLCWEGVTKVDAVTREERFRLRSAVVTGLSTLLDDLTGTDILRTFLLMVPPSLERTDGFLRKECPRRGSWSLDERSSYR